MLVEGRECWEVQAWVRGMTRPSNSGYAKPSSCCPCPLAAAQGGCHPSAHSCQSSRPPTGPHARNTVSATTQACHGPLNQAQPPGRSPSPPCPPISPLPMACYFAASLFTGRCMAFGGLLCRCQRLHRFPAGLSIVQPVVVCNLVCHQRRAATSHSSQRCRGGCARPQHALPGGAAVQRGALGRLAPRLPDQLLHAHGAQLLAVGSARGTRDALVH